MSILRAVLALSVLGLKVLAQNTTAGMPPDLRSLSTSFLTILI